MGFSAHLTLWGAKLLLYCSACFTCYLIRWKLGGLADEERSEMNDMFLARTWLQNAVGCAKDTLKTANKALCPFDVVLKFLLASAS